jgi:hypothetical protein
LSKVENSSTKEEYLSPRQQRFDHIHPRLFVLEKKQSTMHLSLSIAIFLLLEQPLATQAFSVVSATTTTRQQTPLIVLSAEAEEQTDESIYNDMQQMMLALEKRVKGGPGSFSRLEAEELVSMSKRIFMAVAAPAETIQEAEVLKSEEFVDLSDGEEGSVYDGTGGMGLAKGTGNTYVIPGMDSMSPEEYRDALQQSITDRQTVRKESGTYGNRATWNYLNNLTGETGVLKKDINEEFEDDRTNGVTKSAEAPQEASIPPSAPAVVAAPAETIQEGEVLKSEEFVDPSDGEEGAVYDGTGGMGLAKGTGNTYVIPGMDSMSPEEYRAALQQSISDRQTVRKESGTYGNRATWNYLNNLTGETGVLKKDINEEA